MNLQAGASFLLLFVLCKEFSKRKNNYDHHGQFDHRKTWLVFHFNSPKVSEPQPRLSIALRGNIHFDDQFLAAARLLTKRIADTQFDRKAVALPAQNSGLIKCNYSGYRKNPGKLYAWLSGRISGESVPYPKQHTRKTHFCWKERFRNYHSMRSKNRMIFTVQFFR